MQQRGHRYGTPGRPRFLWLHGFLGSGEEAKTLFAPWSQDFDFICPNLPGHGDAPSPVIPLSDTLEWIAELARGCVVTAGYSLGGRLLMMSASRFPESFRTLVVESAFTGYTQPGERAIRLRLDTERAERLRREGLESFCAWWYAQPMWNGLSAPSRAGNPETLANALETYSSAHQPDLRPWLARATSPVLWLAGARDTAYVNHIRSLPGHAPRLRARVVADAGHNIHLERPDAWRAEVDAFINQPPPKEQ